MVEIAPNDNLAEADAAAALGVPITASARIGRSITDLTGVLGGLRVHAAGLTMQRLETVDHASGNDCSAATTSALRRRDSAGTHVVFHAAWGLRSGSAITFPRAGGVNHLQVEEPGNHANIPLYRRKPDDRTNRVTEAEADDATSHPIGAPAGWILGDHSVAADHDLDPFTLAAPASARQELIGGAREVTTCERYGVHSRLQLLRSAATVLAVDDGRGCCSLIDSTRPSPLDGAARKVAAGTAFIRAGAASTSATGGDPFLDRLGVHR